MENEKDKKKIADSMSEIKKAIQSDDSLSQQVGKENAKPLTEFILLEKIVSSPANAGNNKKGVENKKYTATNNDKTIVKHRKVVVHNKKTKKNRVRIEPRKISKHTDPVAGVVDREIKPIIKKWIDKNLRVFVKSIVIEEMKGISKATEKPPGR